jgi:signal peptidase I
MHNESAPLSPRKPLLALLAALLMPGLGQVYNGQINKGFFVFLTFVCSVPLTALASLYLPESLLLVVLVIGVLCAIGAYGYGLVNSYRVARQLGEHYRLRSYNQAATYIAALLFGYIAINALTNYTRQHFVEAFRIPSESMMPSVMAGDFLFADKRVNCPGCKHQIRHGDVVILVYPNNRTRLYIKRVIALPGDTVQITGTKVRVNGALIRAGKIKDLGNDTLNTLLKTHIAYTEKSESGTYSVLWKNGASRKNVTITVPNGHVFVLGDNRDATHDSREFGTVPLIDIVGKAKQIWFSWDTNTGVRWTRLGKSLDVNSK